MQAYKQEQIETKISSENIDNMIRCAEDNGFHVLAYRDIYKAKDIYTEFKLYLDQYEGFCYHHKDLTLIAYDDDLEKHEQERVFFHELGHALLEDWNSDNTNVKHHKSVGEMDLGELIADMFACIMIALNVHREYCN